MSLTNEELNQITRSLGIELPREGIEEHIKRAYGNRPWNVNQVLNDIATCDLTIRPGKTFWEILNRHCSFIPEYDYILGFRSNTFYDSVDLDWLIYKYGLSDKTIDISNKKRATEEIYACLMEIAESTMRAFARESKEGISEQWYNMHHFELLSRASVVIDERIIRKPPLAGSFDKKQELIQCVKDLVLMGFQTGMGKTR